MPGRREGATARRLKTPGGTPEVSKKKPRSSAYKVTVPPVNGAIPKPIPSNPTDPRVIAFLKPTNAFASSQYASSVFEVDPYDVESLHASTHTVFTKIVERATTPGIASNRGRMLLVLGDSGTGKTHLLRGFRRHVQENGHGLAAYAQLNSSAGDYTRYLLQNVIASLSKPYSIPSGKKTGLNQLAHGLALLAGPPLKQEILRLASGDWSDRKRLSLHEYINHLVDGLTRVPELATYDTNLLRVLLYTLCPEQAIVPRLYKYLNCEPMTEHDLQWIGGISPRIEDDAPARTICELANLAYVTQNWCLVLMLDQAEAAGQEVSAGSAFRKAFDTLYRIVNEVPSAIAVIACLSDLYYEVRNHLPKFAIDRLENDRGVQRLQLNRSYEEIQAIVAQRLSRIFDESGVVHRPPPATFPFPEAELRALEGYRTRDVIEWCQEFHTRCELEGRIISDPEVTIGGPERDRTLDEIAAAWNDATNSSGIELPEDDEQVLATILDAAHACAAENQLELVVTAKKNGLTHVQVSDGKRSTELRLLVTNKSPRGGGFRTQLEALCKGVGDCVPIAIRTLPFPQGPACDKALDRLDKVGGRTVYVDTSALRMIVDMAKFVLRFPAESIAEWRRRDRPISTISAMRQMFELDPLSPPSPPRVEEPVVDVDTAADPLPKKKPNKPKKQKEPAATD